MISGLRSCVPWSEQTPLPGIFPLTVWGAQGQSELAELDVPAALTEKWPALARLEGAPAYNVGRSYAALAADIENGTHTVPDFDDAVRRHEIIATIESSAASGERLSTPSKQGPRKGVRA